MASKAANGNSIEQLALFTTKRQRALLQEVAF
jgi:hypothetical protein